MSKNIITMYRGDDYDFTLNILDGDGEAYILREDDIVDFYMMEPNVEFGPFLIHKQVSATSIQNSDGAYYDELGNIVIKIDAAETENLLPGVYYYKVKLTMNHLETASEEEEPVTVNGIETVIGKTKFIIL